jgi:hypothetical protein
MRLKSRRMLNHRDLQCDTSDRLDDMSIKKLLPKLYMGSGRQSVGTRQINCQLRPRQIANRDRNRQLGGGGFAQQLWRPIIVLVLLDS